MERERRLRALVAVDVLARRGRLCSRRSRSRTAAAQGGCDRGTIRTPLARERRADVARDGERRELRLDERRRIERLLVARSRACFATQTATVPGQPQHAARKTALVTEPRQAGETGRGRLWAVEGDAAEDQRLRQTRVVVPERVLEPEPALARGSRVGLLEQRHAAGEQLSRGRLEAVAIETRQAESGVRRGAQRQLVLERADERCEHPPRRFDERGHPRRREHVAERPDRTADVVADVRVVEPAPVVRHEVAHALARVVGRVREECERPVEDGQTTPCRPSGARAPGRRSRDEPRRPRSSPCSDWGSRRSHVE